MRASRQCDPDLERRLRADVVHAQRPGFVLLHASRCGEITCGRDVRCKPSRICAAVSCEFIDTINAATPAATGAEKLVPKTRL